MHDGSCPKCGYLGHAEDFELRRAVKKPAMVPRGVSNSNLTPYKRCPTCKFSIPQEVAVAAIMEFLPYMKQSLAIFEQWADDEFNKEDFTVLLCVQNWTAKPDTYFVQAKNPWSALVEAGVEQMDRVCGTPKGQLPAENWAEMSDTERRTWVHNYLDSNTYAGAIFRGHHKNMLHDTSELGRPLRPATVGNCGVCGKPPGNPDCQYCCDTYADDEDEDNFDDEELS